MEYQSSEPPPGHPTWRPAGEDGHYCVAERYCPCGHWPGGKRATMRVDGKRGQVNLDVTEGNSGNR